MTRREQLKFAFEAIIKEVIEKPRKHDAPPFNTTDYVREITNELLKEVEIRFSMKED